MGWIISEEQQTENCKIVVIDIDGMTDDLIQQIDDTILQICHGKNSIGYDLSDIKKQLYNSLAKNGEISSDVKRGAVAEFFVHVYLNSISLKQECFFLNQEEPKSIKKGFDGLYSIGTDEWIMESKSGRSSSVGISHNDKIKEAYMDLQTKFSSKENENDPWRNAYMHAGHDDIGTQTTIKKKLQQCAKLFASNTSIDISNFNIIPASTIFIVDESHAIPEMSQVIDDISKVVQKFKYREILTICITHHAANMLVEYLKAREV